MRENDSTIITIITVEALVANTATEASLAMEIKDLEVVKASVVPVSFATLSLKTVEKQIIF